MFERSRPHAEFLHIIAKYRNAIWMRIGGFAQVLDDIVNPAERNQVTKRSLSREQPHRFATVFGLIRTKQFMRFKSRANKMKIIDQRVIHLRRGQDGRELRVPYSVGQA